MKESYKVRASQSPWPRVMRNVGQAAGRSVQRGTTGRCIELRKHPFVVADRVHVNLKTAKQIGLTIPPNVLASRQSNPMTEQSKI
jgi:hypothetical protein